MPLDSLWTPRPSRRQTPHIPTTLPTHPRTDAPFSSFLFFSWIQEDAPGLQPPPGELPPGSKARTNQLFLQTAVTQEDAHNLEKKNLLIYLCNNDQLQCAINMFHLFKA